MKYRIRITDTCLTLIENIPDKKIQGAILKRIKELAHDPEKQGKRLVKNLSGFRSMHAAGRYRIIYKIQEKEVIIYVLAAGIRKEGDKKDIYKIAKKLLDAGLLDLKRAGKRKARLSPIDQTGQRRGGRLDFRKASGLGKNIWEGIDVDKYLRGERESRV